MVLWITLSILLVVFILCHCSVSIHFSYQNELKLSLHYLCFSIPLVPRPEKEKKKKEKKPKSKRKKAVEKADKKAKKERTLPETVQLIRLLIAALFPPLDHFRKHLRLTTLSVYVAVGGKDAADCAVSYGRMCGYLSTVLSLLQQAFSVQVKACKVGMNFMEEQTRFVLFGKCKVRVWFFFSTGVYALVCLAKQYLGQAYACPVAKQKGGISHEAASH